MKLGASKTLSVKRRRRQAAFVSIRPDLVSDLIFVTSCRYPLYLVTLCDFAKCYAHWVKWRSGPPTFPLKVSEIEASGLVGSARRGGAAFSAPPPLGRPGRADATRTLRSLGLLATLLNTTFVRYLDPLPRVSIQLEQLTQKRARCLRQKVVRGALTKQQLLWRFDVEFRLGLYRYTVLSPGHQVAKLACLSRTPIAYRGE